MIDIIAGVTELIALYLIGSKNRIGFIVGLACNILWISYVVSSDSAHGLLIVVVPAIILNIRGHYKWSKSEKKD